MPDKFVLVHLCSYRQPQALERAAALQRGQPVVLEKVGAVVAPALSAYT